MVNVGDHVNCPGCSTMGRVVWVSQDKKTMGVRCHNSHRQASSLFSKFGAHVVHSSNYKKDVVFLTDV